MGVRVDNWEEILQAELRKKHAFSWGKSDCVYFAVRIVQAITNVDIIGRGEKEFGKYSTKVGYKKIIAEQWAKYGKSKLKEPSIYGVIDYVCARESFLEIPPSMSQRGDLVMTILRGEQALGIKVGEGACFTADDGTSVEIPVSEITHAWAIR
jgi:hypothetical protein|tara:strand:+ start:1817 stop:2275 length:459 start_codon:yes stop_codon:yes gene_type:complete